MKLKKKSEENLDETCKVINKPQSYQQSSTNVIDIL